MILPMPVATDDEEVIRRVRLEPLTDLIAFVRKASVGVIVVFVGAIRPHKRRGTDEQLPRGIALFDGAFEPVFLLSPPDRLARAIGHSVRRAEVAAIGK